MSGIIHHISDVRWMHGWCGGCRGKEMQLVNNLLKGNQVLFLMLLLFCFFVCLFVCMLYTFCENSNGKEIWLYKQQNAPWKVGSGHRLQNVKKKLCIQATRTWMVSTGCKMHELCINTCAETLLAIRQLIEINPYSDHKQEINFV